MLMSRLAKCQFQHRQAFSVFKRSFSYTSIRKDRISLSSYSDLHSHSTAKENMFAISYITNEQLQDSKDVPAELIIGWSPQPDAVDPNTFVENAKFIDFMTRVLRENIHKVKDSNLKAMAEWQKTGWLHIGDERNPPAWGRINLPEDIIGSVELDEGKIKEGTFQRMPAHRLVTNNGIFRLSEPLTNTIKEAAQKLIK